MRPSDEAQEVMAGYLPEKASIETKMDEAVASEQFGLCKDLQTQLEAVDKKKEVAEGVLKAAGGWASLSDLATPIQPLRCNHSDLRSHRWFPAAQS